MTYAATVLADTPLWYGRLGDASGTTMTDSSGNSRNGVYNGSPTLGVAGLQSSDSDTAISLNGGSQYGSVAAAAWMNVSAFTAEAIINVASFVGTRTILSRYGAAGPNWIFYVTSAGKLELDVFIGGGSSNHLCTGATTLTAGTTYHVAATYDGTTQFVYLSGTQDATASVTGTLNTFTAALLLGATYDPGPSSWYSGTVDEAAFYGSALTSTRIAAHAAAMTGGGGGGGTPRGVFREPVATRRQAIIRASSY